MNTRQKLTLGIAAIFMVTLTIVGVTYAYFVTRVTGDLTETVDVKTANLGNVVYGDGNGAVSLSNVNPGAATTLYKTFTVANLGDTAQPFTIFASTTVPTGSIEIEEDDLTTTDVVEKKTYNFGEFIHSTNGSNEDTGVIADCYSADAKMSKEDGASDVCFPSTEKGTSKYNNIKVTLYQIANDTITTANETDGTYEISGDSALKDFEFTSLTDGQKVTLDNNLTQLNYSIDTTLKAAISIPGKTVYNYVLKVEYLDTALNDIEGDDNQNAENLAGLNVKVSIKA